MARTDMSIAVSVLLAMGFVGVCGDMYCTYPKEAHPGAAIIPGIHFDVTKMSAGSTKWYGAYDPYDKDNGNYFFYFNICGSLELTDLPKGNCTNPKTPADNAVAYRWDPVASECFVLATFGDKGIKGYYLEVHDNDRPAAGVNLVYSQGGDNQIDKCSFDNQGPLPGGSHPNFTIALLCGTSRLYPTDSLSPNTMKHLFVDTEYMCGYEVHAVSLGGCPLECVPDGTDLSADICNGNGHCAYDVTTKSARCFCDDDHHGTYCSESNSVHHSSSQAVGAMFGGIFMALFGVLGFWYYKHRWSVQSGYTQKTDEGFY